jgi:hypothetical protein
MAQSSNVAGTFKSGLLWNVSLDEALFLSQTQSIADNNKKLKPEAYIYLPECSSAASTPSDFQDYPDSHLLSLLPTNPCNHPVC